MIRRPDPQRQRNVRRLVALTGSFVLLVAALTPVALADVEPPPITVPTATVPAPVPDPSPAPAPAAKPKPKPTAHVSRSQPAPAPSQIAPAVPRPSSTSRPQTQKKPFAGTSKRPKTHKPKKHRAAAKPTASKNKPLVTKPADTAPAASVSGNLTSPEQAKWLRWALLLGVASLLLATSLMVAVRDRQPQRAIRGARAGARPLGAGRRPRGPVRRLPRGPVREVVPEVMPRELGRGQAIPLPTPSSQHSPDAEKDDPTPQLEELAPALSARVEAATVATAPAAEPKHEIPDEDATSVEETLAPPMQGGVPVATAEPQTVSRPAIQAERTDQQTEAQLQETATPADNEAVDIATEEICEIAVWRGYAKSRFYGRLDASVLPDGTEVAVAESPPFRFRGNGAPDRTEAAEAAYDALVKKLVTAGWELETSGDAWYASRFRRPLTPA